jgi:hypothetical protein
MILVHKCAGRPRTDVAIINEDGAINIKQPLEFNYSTTLVANISFCPFCGMNLREKR